MRKRLFAPGDRRGVVSAHVEDREALAVPPDQVLVEQRREDVELGVVHLLGRIERPALEDPEADEETLFLRVQEVVAPLDRRPQRPLSLG